MPEFKTHRNITKADIKQWEDDLHLLPGKIQKLHADVEAHQENIKQLEPELKSIDANIAPIDAKIEAISARIEIIESTSKIKDFESKLPSHQSDISCLKNSISKLKERIDFLTSKALDYAEINDISDLNAHSDEQRNLKKPLSAEKARLSNGLETEKKAIKLAASHIDQCQNRLTQHQNNHFLMNLRDNPQGAFDQLAEAMRTQLADYDYRFPAHQTYKVRAYLKDFEENILRIKNLNLPVKVATEDQAHLLDNAACVKYLLLCGRFWQMIDDIKVENPHVAAIMKEVLEAHPVDPSLSLDLYLPYHVMPLSESQLSAYEQKKYDETLRKFSATLDVLPKDDKKYQKLHDLGEQIIDKVRARKSIDIDIKFATLILENSNNLALHPSDAGYQRKQQSLAQHVLKEKSACLEKCQGILLMFLGVAITIGSGIASMVYPIFAVNCISGVSAFGVGYHLFRSGKNDLTQTMHTFERTAKKIEENLPPYAASNIDASAEPGAPVLASDLVDKGAFSRIR